MLPEQCIELASQCNNWKSMDVATKASIAIFEEVQDELGGVWDESHEEAIDDMTEQWAEIIRILLREEGIGT